MTLMINRRQALAVGAGAVVLAGGFSVPAFAKNDSAELIEKFTGGKKPADGKIKLDLPEIAENGNTVPFTLIVDSPMTPADNVKAAHVVSSGNPQPSVASFYFSDLSGRATVTSRMRLAKSQDVIAIAELSDGRFLISTRKVKVTIGGCGG